MKQKIFACAFVLGASMFVAAQQTPPASTPPTFPSDQSQQAPTRPDTTAPSSSPTATPQSTMPDASASASQQSSTDQGSAATQTIQGCVSQDTGMAGGYVLTDDAGTKYSLQGDTSKLSEFVGQEVKVKGKAGQAAAATSTSQAGTETSKSTASTTGAPDQTSATASAPGAGSTSATAAAQVPLMVESVKKIASTCSTAAPVK